MSSLITLKTKSEFSFIYKKGKRLFSKNFTVIFLPADELRFGFVVSKKVGNAVIRNKTKRRLRAISRALCLKNGWYLFLAKPSIKDVKFINLEKEIDKCLLQLKR